MAERPFTREDMKRAKVRLLRDGHMANAVVSRVELDGRLWTVKDFSSRAWWVRLFYGAFILKREQKALCRLRGIDGIAGASFLIDREALAVEFVEGMSMNDVPAERITAAFLEALERLMGAMHARGIVHLDLRGKGNILVRPDGTPALIDFQAALSTGWMPGCIRKLLEDIDLSGALKKWLAYRPGEMGEARKKELERINRLRRLWVFKGYLGLRRRNRDRAS